MANREKALRLGILAMTASGMVTVLHAQTPPGDAGSAATPIEGEEGIADVIVTAQKREERLQDVPVTVAALTGETLQNANFDNVSALQGFVPGMTINQGQSSSNVVHLSLRGISIQDNSKHFESGIGFVLDGVPLGSTTGLLLDSFDVERIEVLRGPQGTLFGRNTTGGAVNVVRSRPKTTGAVTGKARVTIGDYGRNDYEAVISAPLIEGKLGGKVAYLSRNDNGMIYNDFLDTHQGDKNLKDYVVSLYATPTDAFSAQLTLEHQRDKSELPPVINALTRDVIQLPVPGYESGENYPCFSPFLDVCRDEVRSSDNHVQMPANQPGKSTLNAQTLNAELRLSDAYKVVSVTGNRKSFEDSFSYLDATSLGYFPIRQRSHYKQFSQELRLESDLDGKFNFVGGAIYFRSRYDLTQATQLDLATLDPASIGLPGPIPPGVALLTSPIGYYVDYLSKSRAIFLQGEYAFTDALTLIVGGRQTWDRKEADLDLYAAGSGTPSDLRQDYFDGIIDYAQLGDIRESGSASAKFKKFTPKVTLQYRINPDAMVYGGYSLGYNTGGLNARAASLAFIGPYKPETLDAYEVGMKTDWLNRRLRFNVSAFYNIMKDKQEDLTIFTSAGRGTSTVNAAKAEYKGIEVELTAVPVRDWNNSFVFGYLDTKYKEFEGDLGQGEADFSGLKLRRTPKYTAGLISDYEMAAGPGRFGLNGSVSFVDDYETNILNDPRGTVPATTKIDASVRYSMPVNNVDVKVVGFVKNLTDKHPYTGLFSGNTRGGNFEFAIPVPGRTYGVSLEAQF